MCGELRTTVPLLDGARKNFLRVKRPADFLAMLLNI